jgi:hypothetical protein
MTSEELVDTAPPTSESLELETLRPFVYSGTHTAGSQTYSVCVFTPAGWFVRGSLELSGPDSKSFSAQFSYSPVAPNCTDPYTNAEGQYYVIPVKFPAGLAAGTWTVSRLELMDSAGNVSTAVNLGAPVTVTGNQVLTASKFTASPNPANDWAAGNAQITVSMNVTGAADGVAAIYLDFAGEPSGQQLNCQASPGPLTPASTGPDKESVQFAMASLTRSCQVDGIAIMDGAGHLALYGSMYGAPNPDLTVSQVPDKTAPVATSVSISPGTQAGLDLMTIGVKTQVAPVVDVAMRIYNSDSVLQTAADSNGGVDQQGGSVTFFFGTTGLSPGTYTVGFTISDSGGLSTSYGPGGTKPMPGGTLRFTVPSS